MSRQTTDLRPPFWGRFAICAVIVALIWTVFGQTLWHDFVNYDDKVYVYGNSLVKSGLTVHGLAQTFTDIYTANWHPLTLISHMIDCQIFGLKAGGHHFTNVLWHTIAALLLFVFLQMATARFWSAAFVTALFAIHPLRVESVAWIAERKDVLSAVFFFLTLISYVRYVRKRSFGRYTIVFVSFACGLMSKPMLVTTPVILLLLDYWPLGRGQKPEARGQASEGRGPSVFRSLVVEKIPLFGLSAASSLITFLVQLRWSEPIPQLPFSWRFQNALVTYVTYIWQLFWPTKLAVFYPHPDNRLAVWQVGLAGIFLIAVTATAFVIRKRCPYFIVGWLWYLIMLLPVIGIIEVGLQGHADRYTYLPHVGLCIALTWLIADISVSVRLQKQILAAAGVAVVLVCTALAWKQTASWRNTEALWSHALAVTTDNDVALTDLGNFYMESGKLDDALSYLEWALAVRSGSEQEHYRLSLAVIEATIGNVLGKIGRLDEAIAHFRTAVALRPEFPDSHYNLGVALSQKGDFDGAIEQWRTTLALRGNDPGTNTNLANALVQKGFYREAVAHYEITLQSEPDSEMPLNNLAWVLAAAPDDSIRNGARAVDVALRLIRVTQNKNPFYIRTLAAAYAEAGQFDKAIEAGEKASGLAHVQGQDKLAAKIEVETDLYKEHQAYRDPTLPNGQ